MGPHRSRTRLAAIATLGVLAAASPAAAKGPRLVAFGSCRALVGYAHAQAARAGGAGVPMRALQGVAPAVQRPAPGGVVTPTSGEQISAAPAAPDGAPAFSGTNVQEAGIDEPDVVKTDGRRIVAIVDGILRVVDLSAGAPRLVGSLALEAGYGHQLLLRGDRALVLSTRFAPVGILPVDLPPVPVAAPRLTPAPGGPSETLLTEVDLRDPAAPKVARTMTLDGAYVDARMTGGTVRVVVDSTPRPGPTVALARAPLRTFVPATTIRSAISNRTFRRGVVPCDAVRRPGVYSGLDLLTVLTIDLDRGLYSVDRDAIMAGAETVYASDRSLYVASRRYVPGLQDAGDVPAGMRTEIHRFDASVPGKTSYVGSGSVPGFVVNQFALSEAGGALRVASTDEPAWLPEGRVPDPAQSFVSVLEQQGDRLVPVGQVGGLGKGQRIYAVRFLGTAGYVVTFRQIDPLYTLDLSTPTAPRVAGELELPGYSAYLHPVGDGLLLGVGQEATAEGRPQGTQVSLFDVSDLAHPARLQHVVFGTGSSDAEFDHHAFLWWAPTGLAVLPLQTPGSTPPFVGAVGLRVAPGALTEVARVVHGGDRGVAPVSRALVVGDRLYTLSYLGLQAAALDTLAPVDFVAFATPPGG